MHRELYDLNDLVTIQVKHKDDIREFRMVRPLLRWHSSFFNAALDPSGGYRENQTNKIEILEDVEAFKSFGSWIFTKELEVTVKNKDMITKLALSTGATGETRQKREENMTEFEISLKLCKIWVLGEKRGVPALKNAAIDVLHQRFADSCQTNAALLPYVYENTLAGSTLRKFYVTMYTRSKNIPKFVQSLRSTKEDVPQEFLWECLEEWGKALEEDTYEDLILLRDEWAKLIMNIAVAHLALEMHCDSRTVGLEIQASLGY